MSDQKRLGLSQRDRIDIHDPNELHRWTQLFGVSTDALEEAVRAAGNQKWKVRDYLAGLRD